MKLSCTNHTEKAGSYQDGGYASIAMYSAVCSKQLLVVASKILLSSALAH